jgi:hypothetical protein
LFPAPIDFLRRRLAEGMREPAGDRHVRMLCHPERVKAALLERKGEVGRRHRVIGE